MKCSINSTYKSMVYLANNQNQYWSPVTDWTWWRWSGSEFCRFVFNFDLWVWFNGFSTFQILSGLGSIGLWKFFEFGSKSKKVLYFKKALNFMANYKVRHLTFMYVYKTKCTYKKSGNLSESGNLCARKCARNVLHPTFLPLLLFSTSFPFLFRVPLHAQV